MGGKLFAMIRRIFGWLLFVFILVCIYGLLFDKQPGVGGAAGAGMRIGIGAVFIAFAGIGLMMGLGRGKPKRFGRNPRFKVNLPPRRVRSCRMKN